jgi:hypothetical protein
MSTWLSEVDSHFDRLAGAAGDMSGDNSIRTKERLSAKAADSCGGIQPN